MTPPKAPCGGDACAVALAQLAEAANSRDLIGMAKGIVMVEGGLDADGAFAALRGSSQEGHVKLRDVAAEVVAPYDTLVRPVVPSARLGDVLARCLRVREDARVMRADARAMGGRATGMRPAT